MSVTDLAIRIGTMWYPELGLKAMAGMAHQIKGVLVLVESGSYHTHVTVLHESGE